MKSPAPFSRTRIVYSVVFILALLAVQISSPQGVQAQGLSFPAEINKEFSPISITPGQVSRLSITIFNPNLFQLENATWTDNLIGIQPGIFIASPMNLVSTCGNDVTAAPGGTSISLSNGTVPPQVGITPGSCTVSIDVTSVTPGNLINTIPAGGLTGTGGGGTITNTTPASATLQVGSVLPPLITKVFSPNTMWVGQTSQLTIAVNNTDPNVALTQTTFTDTLPAGVVLATPPGATLNGCGAGASLTAASGAGSVTLNNGTINPNGVCLITVNVTSSVAGAYTNTIPASAIQNTQGVTNQSPATAPLNVQGVGLSKSFSPPTFEAGGVSTLTITLQNPTGTPITGVNISDTLPGSVLTVVPGSASTTCGGGTASTTLPRTVSLTNGTIPAGNTTTPGTCTITVQVTSPPNATTASFVNTIPAGAMTSTQGFTNVLPATAPISIYTANQGVGAAKSFFPPIIEQGQNARLRITVTAPPDSNLTNFSLVDNLPADVTISNSSPATLTGCGPSAVLTAVTGATSINLSGATILAGATCQIDVYVTSNVPGYKTNVINPGNITNDQGQTLPGSISADLEVQAVSDLADSKVFTPDIVGPNGVSLLTISLTNTNASSLVNVSLVDNLPGNTTNGLVVAPTPNPSTTCGAGVVTAVPGTQTISLTGGTIPAQAGGVPGLCTITVNVQGRGAANTYLNIIPPFNVSGTIQGTTTVIRPVVDASAPLTVTGLSIGVVKEFNPLTVFSGSASTMNIVLINPNNADLIGINFTDNMPLGMIVATPVVSSVGTCGGTITATAGSGSFTFDGGFLSPFGRCTLSIGITMTVNGNLTNIIPAGGVTTSNGASNPEPTEASLTNLPGAVVSKAFSPNPINVGEYSLLTITIQNTGNIPLSGMGLSDTLPGTLPAGLSIAGTPAPVPVNNCGGTLTAVAGSQSIQLTNGLLGASSLCTIVIPVTSAIPGAYQNIIPSGNLTTAEGATNNTPATDTLVVNGLTTASLGNYVWIDANANGVQDAAETGIDGVTVNLYSSAGVLIATTTTSGGGLYLFSGLIPGDYYVEFVPPAGYVVTSQDQGGNDATDSDANPTTGQTIVTTLVSGENDLTWDAGLYQPASLGNYVWNDTNANGVQDAAEIGIDGVTVNLYSSTGVLIATTTTSGGGLYLFDNLIPGDYYVDFVPPAGYAFSPQDQGGNDAADSDANQLNGQTIVTTLVPGENDLTWDAGLFQSTASLGNYVWNDTNANGIQDAAESGINGVMVNLYSSNGTLIATTTTSGGGLYLFNNLTPGDYFVEFVPPAGYVFSPQDQGGNDTADSDANPANGRTIVTTITAGENDLTWDAGVHLPPIPSGLTKTITATNLPSTAGTNTAVGEIVTYQVAVIIPAGTYANATLVDTMERGLAFVACDSISAPGLTTDVAGSFASICSNAVTSDAGGGTPADVDRRVTYDFGTLINAGPGDATITVTYRAIVLDIAPNVTGNVLNNSASWTWSDGSIGPAQTTVTVVEPGLTIRKTSNVNFIANGSEATFTLTISHTQASNSDAYDAVVIDTLPTGLSYVANSLDCTVGAQDPDISCAFDTNTNTIRAEWSVFTRNGGTGQIRFRVTGNASLPQNGVTNVASVEWTSMPGDQITPQSDTPNIFSIERHYDPNDLVNIYRSTSSLRLTRVVPVPPGPTPRPNRNNGQTGGFLIPVTGFSPNIVTKLDPSTRSVFGTTSLTLEIPSIKVTAPIVGVQMKNGNWDVSWLVDQAGWLEGTAYPTWNGNSVLTAHVVNADGKPGLFARLSKVRTGDYIFVNQSGYRYTYQIVSNTFVKPDDITVLKHEEKAYLTLITCDDYDEETGVFLRRVAVRAVLIDVSVLK